MQFDRSAYRARGYFGRKDGIVGAGVIKAGRSYPERHMEGAAGCCTVPACGPVGDGEGRYDGGERNQAQPLMRFSICERRSSSAWSWALPWVRLGVRPKSSSVGAFWPAAAAVKAKSIVWVDPGAMLTTAVFGGKPSAETTIG